MSTAPALARASLRDHPANPVEWQVDDSPVDYPAALAAMEQRVAAIRNGTAPEMVWLLQHPALYTAGTSARVADLLEPSRFPVFAAGRGGQYTYHGPGQRVAYTMLDLRRRKSDVRRFVHDLEEWAIQTLACFNIRGERRLGRVGVWVVRHDKPALPDGSAPEDKIAAIGVRIRHWVSFHGISLNVDCDLGHYAGIVPCGIAGHGVTSLTDLGLPVSMADVDLAMRESFEAVFGGRAEPEFALPGEPIDIATC